MPIEREEISANPATGSQIRATYPKGKNYCLLIAIDHYENAQIKNLANPVADVQAFRGVVEQRFRGSENQWEFRQLFNAEATYDKIDGALNSLKEEIAQQYAEGEPADNLVIFIAGHGYLDGEEASVYQAYLTPYDAEPGKKNSRLRWNDLIVDYFAHFDKMCFHFLLLVDTCYGGALQPLLAAITPHDPTDSSQARRSRDIYYGYDLPSSWVLTSGRTETVPDGLPGEHSPFAHSLIQYLQDTTDFVVNVQSLVTGIQNRLNDLAFHRQNQPGLRSLPRPQYYPFGRRNEGGQFAFFRPGYRDFMPSEVKLRDAFYQIDFDTQRKPFRKELKLDEHKFGLIVVQGERLDALEILTKSLVALKVQKRELPSYFAPWPVQINGAGAELQSPWAILADQLQLPFENMGMPGAGAPQPDTAQKEVLVNQLLTQLRDRPLLLILDLEEESIPQGLGQEALFSEFWKDLLLLLHRLNVAVEKEKLHNFCFFILNKCALSFSPADFLPEETMETLLPLTKVLVLDPVSKMDIDDLEDWRDAELGHVSFPGFAQLSFDDFGDEVPIESAIIQICEALHCEDLASKLRNLKKPII